jgi:hypothetical protein
MNVAKQWHHSCRVEFERLLLTLWPGAEVMAQLLVAADGSPKDVVSDTVAVKEGNCGAGLDRYDVRMEGQAFLVDHRLLRGRGKCLSRYRVNVNHRLSCNTRDLSANGAGDGRQAESYYDRDQNQNIALHDFSLI